MRRIPVLRLNIRNFRLSIFRKYPSQIYKKKKDISVQNVFSEDGAVCIFFSVLTGVVLHMVMYISFLQMVPSAYSVNF